MPAYNFQKQFAPMVESGQKRQTIRQTDKGAKDGDTAYLYYGQRTKQCRKLGEGKIITVLPIDLLLSYLGFPIVVISYSDTSRFYTGDQLEAFANDDGFKTGDEMVSWFAKQYGLPFSGFLHQWTLNKP